MTVLFGRQGPRHYGIASGILGQMGLLAMALVLVLGVAGCASHPIPPPSEEDSAPYEGGTIQIGDQVKVTFPGAPNLNFKEVIEVDGKLKLGERGEIVVVQRTGKEVEEELIKIYGPDLIVKEISVQVDSLGFPVFVSGAVLKPGKVMVNRSITVLEAIMEAGGFDPNRANLHKVQVIRQSNGVQKSFIIDLKATFKQPESHPFHLRPADVVIVPERFVYF